MAKKRDLKRTINYICSDLFAETIAATLYGNKDNKDVADDILSTIIILRNDFVARVSHPEPGLTCKAYYKKLTKDFDDQVSDIIDKIGNIA